MYQKDRRNVLKERKRKYGFMLTWWDGWMFVKDVKRERKDINKPPRVGQYYDDSERKKKSMRKIKTSEGDVWCS